MTDTNVPIDLPPRYYRDNFLEVVTFIQQRYGDILSDDELEFIQDFLNLSIDAQCIYIRCLLRRGDWFRQEKLQYEEINHIPNALAEAERVRFLQCYSSSLFNIDDVNVDSVNNCIKSEEKSSESVDQIADLILHIHEWINSFTKQELLDRLPQLSLPKSIKRAELEQHVIAYLEEDPAAIQHFIDTPLICVFGSKELATISLLFFGNNYQDFTEFVLRDLGIYQYYPYQISQDTRWCKSREQLQSHRDYADFLETQPAIRDAEPEELLQFNDALNAFKEVPSLRRRVEKLQVSIARQLERVGDLNSAEVIYRVCQRMPARERLCRILAKQKRLDELVDLLKEIALEDCHPEEQQFLPAFLARQKLSPQQSTQLPTWLVLSKHSVSTVHWSLSTVARESARSIESQCLFDLLNAEQCLPDALMIRQPTSGFYCENILIPGIFGLFFWDIIFADIEGAFFHPFHTRPVDLYSTEFSHRRRELIEERLHRFSNDELLSRCRDNYEKNYGYANDCVIWPALNEELMEIACEKIPASHWRQFFQWLLQDIRHCRSGLPDLILFDEDGYQLLEVKGPGDTLQKNQQAWFQRFQSEGIPAQVLKVELP